MTSEERHTGRRKRREALHEAKRQAYKKPYDDFENICSLKSLYNAEKQSRKGVCWKASVQKYEINLLRNLVQTRNELLSGKDIRKGFIEFDLHERGKIRHIRSMHYYERVVQRSVCDNALVPVLSRSLVYDNGASLKNKGISFAIKRVKRQLTRYYRRYRTNEGWVLVMDFSGFFDHIQRGPLKEMVERSFDDARLKRLIVSFIDAFGEEGLGIGSQVSQILAVSYPNHMDHYLREVLRIGLCERYMDDSVIFARNKETLKNALEHIRRIAKELGIILNTRKTFILPLKRFTFLKVRFQMTETGKLILKPGRRAFRIMRRKLKAFAKMLERQEIGMEQVRNAWCSFAGYHGHYNSYTRLKRLENEFCFIRS